MKKDHETLSELSDESLGKVHGGTTYYVPPATHHYEEDPERGFDPIGLPMSRQRGGKGFGPLVGSSLGG